MLILYKITIQKFITFEQLLHENKKMRKAPRFHNVLGLVKIIWIVQHNKKTKTKSYF